MFWIWPCWLWTSENNGPTPADDTATQIITDWGNLTLVLKQSEICATPTFPPDLVSAHLIKLLVIMGQACQVRPRWQNFSFLSAVRSVPCFHTLLLRCCFVLTMPHCPSWGEKIRALAFNIWGKRICVPLYTNCPVTHISSTHTINHHCLFNTINIDYLIQYNIGNSPLVKLTLEWFSLYHNTSLVLHTVWCRVIFKHCSNSYTIHPSSDLIKPIYTIYFTIYNIIV